MGRRGSQEELVFDSGVIHRTPSKVFIILIGVLIVAVLVLAGALVYFVVENDKCHTRSPYNGDVCESEQCIKSAAVYLESMDKSVDPCKNFYDYACGGWVKKHVIPEDRSRYSAFDILDEDVTVKCRESMQEDPVLGEPKAITNVRTFYKSCLDIDTIDKLETKPLTDTLNAVGGWPVLMGDDWNPDAFSFETLLALLGKEYSIHVVINSGVGVDDKNSSIHVLFIDQPGLLMGGRDYYLETNYTKEREAYQKYMVEVAVALGASKDTATTELASVLEFETHIAELTVPASQRRNGEDLYNVFTLKELETKYNKVNWTNYYNQFLPTAFTPLPETERIINQSPDYIGNVTEWLSTVEPKTIANYMVWRLVHSKIGLLGEKFLDIQQDFFSVLHGTTATSARWKRCIGEVQANIMEFATGKMYVKKYFPEDARTKTLEMVNNLKTAFKEMLKSNDWLAEQDKKVAAQKADSMRVNVGFPDWILNNTKLDDYYSKLTDFVEDKYYENVQNYVKWGLDKELGSLREPVDKDTWEMGPAVVNAYYNPSQNKIVFPAGILQPPFYHKDLPWYSNYGGMGVVIGHEITHGFDDQGRQYDKDGNLKQWWSQQSIDNFVKRAQCIVDQYSDFVMPENGQHLNGQQTQGENIADNGGLKESLKAYHDNTKSQPALPGINLTNEQMFFLSYGQVWCSLFRPEAVADQILSNPHSPGRYRVIGATQNSEAFAEAFNCKAGSYMNPKNKCKIW